MIAAEPNLTPVTVGGIAGTVAPCGMVTVPGAMVTLLVSVLASEMVTPPTGAALTSHTGIVAEVEEYSTLPVDDAVWRHGGVIVRHPVSAVLV